MLYKERMNGKKVRLGIALLATFAAGSIGSLVTYPSLTWYGGLSKPDFTPPDWVFGPVWTLLYVAMAVSLYLVWTTNYRGHKRAAFVAFGVQLVLNALWSLVFFGAHDLAGGVAVILALWLMLVVTMVCFWPISRLAVLLLVPYLAWVSFATVLNVALVNKAGTAIVNSYDDCVKRKGSVILESYPPICMTPDKRSFTNPHEKPKDKQSTSLTVQEWGVSLPLTEGITDAYYTYDKDNDQVFLTTVKLEQTRMSFQGCQSGMHGLYVKIDGGRLREQPQVETLCAVEPNEAVRTIESIQAQLRTAIDAIIID